MSPPPPHTPTIHSIERVNSSHTKSSNEPVKTGSQPYCSGMRRLVRSRLMARPCVESRSLALTPIISAYDPHIQLVLSVDAVPIKSNELESIHLLLDELDVTNALVTLDALGCQRQVADQILQVGGNYSSARTAGVSTQAKRPRTWSYWPR